MTWDTRSLVEPVVAVGGPGDQLLGLEPEGNFPVGGLHRVRAVDDVASSSDAEVTTDGSGLRSQRVGGTQHNSASLDNFSAFPDHGDDGARKHVGDQLGEEWLLSKILVVILEQCLSWLHKLEGHKVVASALEPLDDLSNEASLDSVGLHHDV